MTIGAKDPLDTEVRYVDADSKMDRTSLRQLDLGRAATALPVRRGKSHASQHHYSGRFWSATPAGHAPYESRLELDRLWLADFDPGVRWIAAKPMWFTGQDEGVLRRHAPDLLLTDQHGSMTVVDVKPTKFVKQPQVQAVFRWTARLCQAKGVRYEVWSGAEPVALANIRAFAVARRGIEAADLAAASAAGRTGITVGQVEDLPAAARERTSNCTDKTSPHPSRRAPSPIRLTRSTASGWSCGTRKVHPHPRLSNHGRGEFVAPPNHPVR